MTAHLDIPNALAALPPGRWVVGVSGGADSVALLVALAEFRADVEPVVAHLNHETRGDASDGDADFVTALADRLGVARVVERISSLAPVDEPNAEARFRRARHALFARLVAEHRAVGVLLAHHADDRAETTLLRLLRGQEATALDGLRAATSINGLRVRRPLLPLRRSALEAFLRARAQPWREDASNADPRFARNRARRFLARRPSLVGPLLALADAADAWSAHVAARAPTLSIDAECDLLADAPAPLARAAARRWLRDRGADALELSAGVADRLLAMARDASVPPQTFPGGVVVRRVKARLVASAPS